MIDPVHERHSRYFDLVKPTAHWKDPIKAVIRRQDFIPVSDAVFYFTTSELQITANLPQNMIEVQADGYRLGPAGDH